MSAPAPWASRIALDRGAPAAACPPAGACHLPATESSAACSTSIRTISPAMKRSVGARAGAVYNSAPELPMQPKPALKLQTTTLWYYPSQQYGGEPQGDPRFKGAT